jgi:FkbM family methyltransferase
MFNSDPAQRTELDLFIRYCRPGMQFLDIGAHYGLFALAAHRFGGSRARIVCVEASPKAAQILRANLDANRVRNVSLFNIAMGASDGSLEMLSTGPAGSDYFVSVPAGRSDSVTVPQFTMSTVLCETGLLPTHVKMDVEGFEHDVIAGALSVLKEHHPILFLELHGGYLRARQRDPALVISQLRECGYERIEEAGAEITDDAIARRNFECRLVCFDKCAN